MPRCAFHLYDHCDALGKKKASYVFLPRKLLVTETYSVATSDQSNNNFLPLCARYFAIFCIVFPLFVNKEPPPAKSVESSFQNESNPPITFVPDPIN